MTEQASPSCLFEAHLTVSDLSWAVTFYRDVVGLQVAYELAQRGAAFFRVGPALSALHLHEVLAQRSSGDESRQRPGRGELNAPSALRHRRFSTPRAYRKPLAAEAVAR